MNPTDIDESEPVPQGTKRRGSIEKKEEEDNTNLTAPDVAPDTITDEEPQPIEQKETQPTKKNNNNNKTNRPIIIANNKPFGHRRRNTDGALRFNPKTKMFTNSANSNAAVIQLMAKELPLKERLAMQQKSQDLKLSRDLKHAQIKLTETQDQCNTAVEIIGKLEEEKEDLLSINDTLNTKLGAAQTEVKILEQKNKSLEELYRSDLRTYKDEVSTTKKQLSELTDDIHQKDMQLSQAKQYSKNLQQQLGTDDTDDTGNIINIPSTKKEKRLLQQLESEQTKVIDKNKKIEELMSQLEGLMRTRYEKEGLQKEINAIAEMTQQDLMYQKEQMEKMQTEIITLASRNSSLEKERDDLMQLLEERDYENQMLKTGYGLHRNKTTNITQNDMNSIAHQITGHDEDFDEQFNSLAFMQEQQPIDGDDLNDYESEEYTDKRDSLSESPDKRVIKPKQKEVADVTREYLHLTASVVNMKFPRVQHIPSEELINKVKNYQFWEYHDMMVRIMKTEEQKLLEKEKADAEEKKQQQMNQNPKQMQSGGMLGRFRNFFGGANPKQKTGRDRKKSGSMVDTNTQNQKLKSNIRNRNKSATGRDKRGGSATDKKAPTIADAKQKVKQAKDSGKKVVDSVYKKVTNQPSDEQIASNANMSFQSVPRLGTGGGMGGNNNEKASKPKQGL